MLSPVGPGLWTATARLAPLGIEVGTRMTVARLPDGRLWLHSPIPATAKLAQALAGLGPVAALVAPNRVHHLFFGGAHDVHSGATTYGAPGLAAKRRDLIFHRTLGDQAPPEWRETFDQHHVKGIPMLEEIAFLHKPSRTLVLTDLAFHMPPDSPSRRTRLWMTAMGVRGRFASSRMVRWLVRDRRAARASLDRILAWDFERISVTHGAILEDEPREQLRAAWSGLAPG